MCHGLRPSCRNHLVQTSAEHDGRAVRAVRAVCTVCDVRAVCAVCAVYRASASAVRTGSDSGLPADRECRKVGTGASCAVCGAAAAARRRPMQQTRGLHSGRPALPAEGLRRSMTWRSPYLSAALEATIV